MAGRRTALERPQKMLWLPPAVFLEAAARCQCCGKPFTERDMRRGGAYEKHVVACAEEHDEELRALRHANDPVIGEDVGDTELKLWIDKHRVALIEGRKRL